MFADSVELIQMKDVGSISVCIWCENDEIFELGERINEKYENAYMNGYGWGSLVSYYVHSKEPKLLDHIQPDPEAGMYSARMDASKENLKRMKRFEKYIKELLKSEESVMSFIEKNYEHIEWD